MDRNARELTREAEKGLANYIKARTCCIPGIGTGNIVRAQGRTFIATCRHVADYYFSLDKPYVVLFKNERIPKARLNYIVATKKEIDIALIEVVGDTPQALAYELDSFEIIENFSSYPLDKDDLWLIGFPGELRVEDEHGNWNYWMRYSTIPYEHKPSSEDFLFLSYPIGAKKVLESTTGAPTELPEAPGLSGSFILKIVPFDVRSADLWAPSLAKVIAMQIAWDEQNFLVCSNIKHLFELLEYAGIRTG